LSSAEPVPDDLVQARIPNLSQAIALVPDAQAMLFGCDVGGRADRAECPAHLVAGGRFGFRDEAIQVRASRG
jgi:hypothetical protein